MSESTKGLIIRIPDPKDPSTVLVTWDGEPVGHIEQIRISISAKTSRINIAMAASRGMFRSVTKLADKLGRAGIKAVVSVKSARSAGTNQENIH